MCCAGRRCTRAAGLRDSLPLRVASFRHATSVASALLIVLGAQRSSAASPASQDSISLGRELGQLDRSQRRQPMATVDVVVDVRSRLEIRAAIRKPAVEELAEGLVRRELLAQRGRHDGPLALALRGTRAREAALRRAASVGLAVLEVVARARPRLVGIDAVSGPRRALFCRHLFSNVLTEPRRNATADGALDAEKPRFAGLFPCARVDSNHHELSAHKALNLARLPIPPRAQGSASIGA